MPQRYIISMVSNATLKMNNDNNINIAAIKLCVGWGLYHQYYVRATNCFFSNAMVSQ